MISLQFGLPLIRREQGNTVAFDTIKLRAALAQAASQTGYPDWWQADDLVEGITSYLRQNHIGAVIDLSRLKKAIHTVLCGVGYYDVADRFSSDTPCVCTALVESWCQMCRRMVEANLLKRRPQKMGVCTQANHRPPYQQSERGFACRCRSVCA